MKQGKTLIMMLLMLLGTVLGASAQKTYIVCVGLGQYDDGKNSLPCSEGDMRSLAEFYHKQGNADVFLLMDKNATRNHILRVLKKKFAEAGPKDQIIFAYSGHGFEGGVSCYDHKNLVYCSEVQEIMQKSRAARKMIFINSCHSGSFSKKYNKKKGQGYKSKNSNIMLYMSSRAEEPSWERTDMKCSFFIHHLLNGLGGRADANRDGHVTARELFNYVNSGVIKDTKDKQHPQMYGRFADDMIVITPKK